MSSTPKPNIVYINTDVKKLFWFLFYLYHFLSLLFIHHRMERLDKCKGCGQAWYRKDGTKADCGSRKNLQCKLKIKTNEPKYEYCIFFNHAHSHYSRTSMARSLLGP